MPKRMIHTNIWASGQVAKLSRDARLLYVGTITLGDDDGRLKGNAAFLRSQIFPYDEELKTVEVKKWLDEIIKSGLLKGYEVNGEEYLLHPNWMKYQTLRADRKKESHIPEPDDNQVATNGQPDDGQFAAQDKVRKGKVSKEKVMPNGELTPKEKTILFFEAVDKQNDAFHIFVQQLAQQNTVPPESVRRELKKFADYWTETNGTGTKMRWQMEKVFEIRRRLATWFGRVGFKNFSAAQQSGKGKNIIL